MSLCNNNSSVRFGGVTTSTSYGSTDNGMEDTTADMSSNNSESSQHDDVHHHQEGQDSIHSLRQPVILQQRNLAGVCADNIWTNDRKRGPTGVEGGEPERQYNLVPTQIKDNVKLVNDPNLADDDDADGGNNGGGAGRLYYKASAFYNPREEPQYALTMNPAIFQQILNEVVDATSTPCGLYFCCHGGDGAHTGVSHDDYVDIRLAWILVGLVFGGMLTLFRLDHEL
jgi:hypothetical protein